MPSSPTWPVVVVATNAPAGRPSTVASHQLLASGALVYVDEDEETDDALDDVAAAPAPPARPARKGKRASVPSWDEIMFGGPKPG